MSRRTLYQQAASCVTVPPVEATVLSNGLRALVVTVPESPVVVCDAFYRVGSVDDPEGLTGLAHFVEHMLFKATERLPRGQIDRLVFLAGGTANAETSEDDTHYWSVFPRDRWEVALEIEAERMARASFEAWAVEAERRVIREERARELEVPSYRLEQTHLCASYRLHPYRNPILGWPDDVERITAEDLWGFYRAHYRPGAAVLVVAGNVEPSRVLKRIESRFGRLPRGPVIRRPERRREPRQRGRRSFYLREPGELTRGLLGWHGVPRGHEDLAALEALADVLAYGRRSRLWDRLVECERVAGWIDAWHDASRLAGLFSVHVEGLPRVSVRFLESLILEEVARVGDEGVLPEELERARVRQMTAWRWDQDDLVGLSAALGQAELHGSWRDWVAEQRNALLVTEGDIRRVARRYLTPRGVTVGWLGANLRRRSTALHELPRLLARPSVDLNGACTPDRCTVGAESSKHVGKLLRGLPTRPAAYESTRVHRVLLPNGMRLLTEPSASRGVVALELYFDSGIMREAKPGLANLVARLREEGTQTRNSADLAHAIEGMGAQIEVHPTGLTARVGSEDLAHAVELMADVIVRPAFPAEAFGWVRSKIQADLRADREDPAYRASQEFLKLVYGDHPFGRDHRGSPRDVSRLGLDDARTHHARYFAPDNGFLVAVGDFDPGQLVSLVRAHFGRWKAGGRRMPRVARPRRRCKAQVRRIRASGEQAHVLLGHLGVARDHEDYPALVVLDHLLGSGPGLTNHLGRILREELGLAYSVEGGIAETADLLPGVLRIYLGTGPEDVERAVAAARGVLEELHRGCFEDGEVREVQRHLASAWVLDHMSVAQRAERLLEQQRWGLPLDAAARWPDRIMAVTPADVRRAAARHLKPHRLIQLEYGPILRRKRAAVPRAGRSAAVR